MQVKASFKVQVSCSDLRLLGSEMISQNYMLFIYRPEFHQVCKVWKYLSRLAL